MTWTTIPYGLLIFSWCTLMALAPIRRPRRLATMSWLCANVVNEAPFLYMAIIAFSEAPGLFDGGLGTTRGAVSFGLSALTVAGLALVARRAAPTRRVVDAALDAAWSDGDQTLAEPATAAGRRRRLPWARILLAPWPIRPRPVERARNIAYGDHGRQNLLDVYRHRSHPTDAPTLIHFHGGRFRWGHKSFESRALLHRFARQGWTCISANYRLSPTPGDGFPTHLVDAKKVVAWARTHADRHGIDPDTIVVAGSSAGAHLTAMLALTPNAPRFQPGFEDLDTTIAAGVGLYGYYGPLDDEDPSSSPLAHTRADTPPFCVIHGDHDTYTPVEGARRFVAGLRASSTNPVAYAELPGAQHSFDLFHSIRFEIVIDAIESFTASVRARSVGSPTTPGRLRAGAAPADITLQEA